MESAAGTITSDLHSEEEGEELQRMQQVEVEAELEAEEGGAESGRWS